MPNDLVGLIYVQNDCDQVNDEGTSTKVQSLMGCCGSKSWKEEWGASGGKESSVDWVNNILHIFYKLYIAIQG